MVERNFSSQGKRGQGPSDFQVHDRIDPPPAPLGGEPHVAREALLISPITPPDYSASAGSDWGGPRKWDSRL